MTEVGLVALVMTFVIVTGGIDLSVGSILGLTAILLGVFWKNMGLPLPVAIGLGARRRHPRRRRQRLHHHPLPRAAADRHARHAGALPRPRRGHQPGALGARLSRVVLRPRPGRGRWACRPSSGSSALVALVAAIVLGLHDLGPHHLRHRLERDRRALLGPRGRRAPRSRSTPPRASRRRSRRRSSSRGSRPRAPTWAPASSSTRSPPSCSAAPRSSAAAAPIVGTLLGLVLIQALKNGLSLAGVKGDGTIVLIGAVLILTILISNLFHRDGKPVKTAPRAEGLDKPDARQHGGNTMLRISLTAAAVVALRRASPAPSRPGPAATTCRPTRSPATAPRRRRSPRPTTAACRPAPPTARARRSRSSTCRS